VRRGKAASLRPRKKKTQSARGGGGKKGLRYANQKTPRNETYEKKALHVRGEEKRVVTQEGKKRKEPE